MTPVSEESVKLWIMSAYGVLWLRYQRLLHVVGERANVPTEILEAEVQRWIDTHSKEQQTIIRDHLQEILSSAPPQG